MKAKKERHLGLRIEDELLSKLRYVSESEGRSINGHITYLIRRNIMAFEKAHGEIEYPPRKQEQ